MPVLPSTTSSPPTSSRFRRLHSEMKEIKVTRGKAQHFLRTKFHHYLLLALISIDVASIFADIFISLYSCEEGRDISKHRKGSLEHAREALEYASLAFSSLFLLELFITIWAYEMKYFKSKFHLFDGSVIILRLWRFVKIIEEATGAEEDRVEELQEKVKELQNENREMKNELKMLRTREA